MYVLAEVETHEEGPRGSGLAPRQVAREEQARSASWPECHLQAVLAWPPSGTAEPAGVSEPQQALAGPASVPETLP